MLSDKAMLVGLHISMWSARKHDKSVSTEVAEAHEANVSAGRYNKHLLVEAEKLEELRALANQIRLFFYKMTLPWTDEGYRLLPSASYFEFTKQFAEFKVAFDQLVREFLEAYPYYREQARAPLGGLHRDSDYPDIATLAEKFDLKTDILPIPCGEDFRVTLGQEEQARVAREIDQQVKQSVARGMGELWSRLKEAVAHLAAQLERPKARLHSATLRNVAEIAQMVPRLNIANDEELTALAKETNSRLACFSRQDLLQYSAARSRAAGIANELAAKINRAMKDRGYDESAGYARVAEITNVPEAVVEFPNPQTDLVPQTAPANQADQIVARMFDYMELMAS